MNGKAETAFTSPQAMARLARHVAAGEVSCGCQGGAKVPPNSRVQSRRASLVESVTQTGIGYLVALATQAVVFPLAGIDVSPRTHAWIGLVFVAVSLARGYVLRRIFARL